MNLYVGYPNETPNFETIREALLSIDACPKGMDEESITRSFTDKTFPAKESDLEKASLYIAPGKYIEKLVVTRPNVEFLGEDAKTTVISYGDGAFDKMLDGTNRGTFRTATVRIDTHDFFAKNVTFENTAGIGHIAGQALALYVDGDRNRLENCILLGNQDTLFTAPLPLKEAQPGGFTGPGELHPRVMGRHLYKNCYIEGNVDFIFGSATCVFDHCTLFSKNVGDKADANGPAVHGYITAASTPETSEFGYVFFDCTLTGDCPKHSVYLGRPWREYAKTVFIRCEMGEHIRPEGYTDWGKDHNHFFYGEYDCKGNGANTSERVEYAHFLSNEDVQKYTLSNIFGDWKF